MEDMGGRHGLRIRRWRSKKFVHTNRRRRPWCSRSARNLHEISPRPWLGCVKRSIFRPIHCIASTSSEDLQVNV
ncbi:hypothetical protein ACE6H2_022155 [Prunus campanulata]